VPKQYWAKCLDCPWTAGPFTYPAAKRWAKYHRETSGAVSLQVSSHKTVVGTEPPKEKKP
jgi:hypothetical protein